MMDSPIVFIGYDKNEKVAAYVLAHSIQRNARGVVNIVFLNRAVLPFFTRIRHELDSTDFSISRFLVPYLCGYSGYALFIDCDCLVLGDIYDLWDLRDAEIALKTVQHKRYIPKEQIKFLGAQQTAYSFKNWSSVMLFNCAKCANLTLEKINNSSLTGLYFHQFKWLGAQEIISKLPAEWNVLIGQQEVPEQPKLLHFTQGGPYFEQFRHCQLSGLWFEEFRDMIYANTGFLHESIK